MALFLLIAGIGAAVVVGVAWALHRHELAESADKVGQWAVAAAAGLGVWEVGNQWNEWQHDRLIPKGEFQSDGTYVSEPAPPPPNFGHQVGHIAWQALIEFIRDLAVSALVFAILFLVIRLARANRPSTQL